MEPYQERVIAEQKEVQAFAHATQERLIKLVDFQATDIFLALPVDQRHLLNAQAPLMQEIVEKCTALSNVLQSRISTF